VFSKGQDGQFMLTSRAEAVRIKGGANALIEIPRQRASRSSPALSRRRKRPPQVKNGWDASRAYLNMVAGS
jgi:hypothetical protein